jgi:hypothetical protein
MRRNLIDSVKDQIMLHDHHPECISPIPSVILDNSMSVNLDPEVEGDQRPAKDPSEDVHEHGMIRREVKVGPGE